MHLNSNRLRQSSKYSRGRIGLSRGFNFIIFLLIGLVGRASAKDHFYGFCFRTIADADVNADSMLEPTEFTNFIISYTRGVAKAPLPQDLVSVFMSVADTTAMQLAVPGVNEGASQEEVVFVSKLCYAVNSVVQKLLKVAITSDQCMGALRSSDLNSPKGQISEDEYISFLRALTGEPYDQVSTINDLDLLSKSVFEDMNIEGVISGGAGAEYLGEFCYRAKIAQALDKIANQLYPETAVKPSSNTSQEADESDQEASGTDGATGDRNEVSGATNTTEVAVDTNNTGVAADTSTIENSVEGASEDTADVEVAKSGVDTSANGTESDESGVEVEMTSELLEKCRLGMIFIDKNRDNLLDKNEFGLLVDRLQTEIEDGMSYQQAISNYDAHYEDMKETFGGAPSLQGSKPTQIASDEEAETLRAICRTTYVAMEDVKNPAGSIGKDGVHVKQSVSEGHQAIALEPAVMKECKRSIYVSDRDRNGGLDVDEFVYFLNRLRGENDEEAYLGFAELHEVFHEIYRDFSSYSEGTNSFMVSSMGSRPGSAATSGETAHLDSVCEAVFFAFKELSIV